MKIGPLLCVVIALAISEVVQATEAPRVSICELIARPEKYNGAVVEVHGQTEGRWFEDARFEDPLCGRVGRLNLEGEPKSTGLDQLISASRALDEARAPDTESAVAAVLIGRFKYRHEESFKYVLVVSRVEYIDPHAVASAIPPIPPPKLRSAD